jgi:uncharacterized protein (DUF2164 family)
MSEEIIPPSNDCPGRKLYLKREREARLAIEAAERRADFPWQEIGAFLYCQGARLEHEDHCRRCATELGVAA